MSFKILPTRASPEVVIVETPRTLAPDPLKTEARLRDLQPLAEQLNSFRERGADGPMAGRQSDAVEFGLKIGSSVVRRTGDSADLMEQQGLLSPSDASTVRDAAAQTKGELDEARRAASAQSRGLRKTTYSDGTLARLERAQGSVQDLETLFAKVSGAERNTLRYDEPSTLGLTEADLDAALQRADLRRAFEYDKPQSAIRRLGDASRRLFFGENVAFEGLEHLPEGGFILAPVHTGDILRELGLLTGTLDAGAPGTAMRPLAQDLSGGPRGLGQGMMIASGAVPIAQGADSDATLALSQELLRRGLPLVGYPEGHVYPVDEMGLLQNGLFRLSLVSHKPIVGMTVEGAKSLVNKDLGRSQKGVLIRILPAVHPQQLGPDGTPPATATNVGTFRDQYQRAFRRSQAETRAAYDSFFGSQS